MTTETARTKHCISCEWWDDATYDPAALKIPADGKLSKACRRYPEIAWRKSTDWCGEWSPIRPNNR